MNGKKRFENIADIGKLEHERFKVAPPFVSFLLDVGFNFYRGLHNVKEKR